MREQTRGTDAPDPLALADYVVGAAIALTDGERWPGLSDAGAARLEAVLAHPNAPAWRHRTGHRLDADAARRASTPLPTAGWLDAHLATARALPAYRRYPGQLDRLDQFPLVSRDDLLADIAAFVPLDADLESLVGGSSSGSTGHALRIPDHIEDVVRTFWLIHEIVEALGIPWRPDPQRLAVAHLVYQRQAFTYASVVPAFGESPMARVNLHGDEWAPGQRMEFFRAMQPQLITGSASALARLLEPDLAPVLRPLALVSGAVHLSAALRADLESTFGCPVIDIYGLHETRPIAVSTDGGPFRVLDRRVLVEVLDAGGEPVPRGERGEIVVTAGSNPLLPLVRYRTGDYGRLDHVDGRPAIADLEGRADVDFLSADGREIPSVDLTQQLQHAAVRAWTVSQDRAGTVRADIVGGDARAVSAALAALLGREPVVIEHATIDELGGGKPRRYVRES